MRLLFATLLILFTVTPIYLHVTLELNSLRELFERVAATRTIERSIRVHCREGPLSFRTSIALLVDKWYTS